MLCKEKRDVLTYLKIAIVFLVFLGLSLVGFAVVCQFIYVQCQEVLEVE